MQNWGERIFSNRQLGIRVYIKMFNDNDVRIVNFATSKNLVIKSTIFPHRNILNTPGPVLMGRLTTILIIY
jgi:hypothetical protein